VRKPILAILAAGIGSRYGGLKQIDPVGANGELIIDYSIYDALRAGFTKIVFIIKHEIEEEFREIIGDRMEKNAEVAYAYQELDQLPPEYVIPEGREKPWGTAHALLAAKERLNGPFAVINADDYYGPNAYRMIYEWLSRPRERSGKHHFAMVGYRIENTVSEFGTVTRGVCEESETGFLTGIAERTMIEKTDKGARFSEDKGETWTDIPAGTLVSMNFWGLDEGFFGEAERDFIRFLDNEVPANPLKSEYLMATEIGGILRRGAADVKVLESPDAWYGVTYRKDKEEVVNAINDMHKKGDYPTPLWG